MKYFSLVLLFSYSVLISKGQDNFNGNETDSLVKYSYNISGKYNFQKEAINPINYSGTGFFINVHDKTLFVTAGHVLSGCKDKAEVRKYYPDEMNINLNDENGHFTWNLLPVNLKELRDTGVCPAIKYPDIGAYQVPDSFKNKVFSIESLIKDDVAAINGTIKIYGFPISKNAGQGGYSQKESTALKIDNYKILDSLSFINSQGELETDSTNYILLPKGIAIDASLKGYSGSPVFEFNESSWRFIGVLMGANIPKKFLVIVKPKYLEEKLLVVN
jgi:hypothetical protein